MTNIYVDLFQWYIDVSIKTSYGAVRRADILLKVKL